jgi:hypothetical protein
MQRLRLPRRALRDVAFGSVALALGFAVLRSGATALAGEAPTGAPAPAASPTTNLPAAVAAPPLEITPSHPARVASYTLSARLDDASHEITAEGSITFRNVSSRPIDALYLHLYLNAFKNEKSLFLRSPFGEGRGGGRAADWGYLDVQRCVARELGGVDLWPTRTPGTPEDPDDETDVRLPLPRPLAPNETLTLELGWKAKLPAVVLRTGYAGRFHFSGQWFPKLARLEPDGSFAHFRFHPQAEFYADFGDYDVTLDVPADSVLGASGLRVESRSKGARRVDRFRAEAVHDFAWTAWPGFLELNQRIDGVAVRLLYPPGHARNATASLEAVRRVLPHASRRYGRYPYPTLTLVHPPESAAEAGGMEYPTLITTGGPWFAGLAGDRAIEAVTVHELMHQWFYGLVATNEARFPFLDEGLTTYAELEALDRAWGPASAFGGFGLSLSATSLGRVFGGMRAEDAAVSSSAAELPGFRTLATLVYSRTATILQTLGRVYGETGLESALRDYAESHRFGHPLPADLFAAIERHLGADAAAALKLAVEDRGQVDYLVRDLQNAYERPPAGVFDRASGRETLPVEAASPAHYRGRAVVVRHGTLAFPVDIELVAANGGRARQRWDGRGPFHVVEWRGDSPLTRVVVDPEARVLLDDNLMNNALSAKPAAPLRTLERSSYFASLLLAWLGP